MSYVPLLQLCLPYSNVLACRQKTVADIIRITGRILDTLDWSPFSPALVSNAVMTCLFVLSDALVALYSQRDCAPGVKKLSFSQLVLIGVPSERISALFQQLAHWELAPSDLRDILLLTLSTFVNHGFGEDIKS